jgi:hypothetical protein
VTAAVVALLVSALLSGAANASSKTPDVRYRQLKKVVDRNVGHAHLTRGMNTETVRALKSATTAKDIPVLKKMLGDSDRVAAMTAANVLMEMGPDGRSAAYHSLQSLPADPRRRLSDTLTDVAMSTPAQAAAWTEDIPLWVTMAESDDRQQSPVGIWFLGCSKQGREMLREMAKTFPASKRDQIAIVLSSGRSD